MTLDGGFRHLDFSEQVTVRSCHPYDPWTGWRDGMSDLIPNLEDLREQLPMDGTAPDAHEFIGELAVAASIDDLGARVDALVDRWLEVPDDDSA